MVNFASARSAVVCAVSPVQKEPQRQPQDSKASHAVHQGSLNAIKGDQIKARPINPGIKSFFYCSNVVSAEI